MIQYNDFAFATAPRTASTWFLDVACQIGLGEGTKTKLHIPFPEDCTDHKLMMVRHPYAWLVSYFLVVEGGHVGVPAVDEFSIPAKESKDEKEFIRRVIREMPGSVGKMFDEYKSDSVIRVEDLPFAAVGFFESVGADPVQTIKACMETPPRNARKGQPHVIDKELFSQLIRAESDFRERYEYF